MKGDVKKSLSVNNCNLKHYEIVQSFMKINRVNSLKADQSGHRLRTFERLGCEYKSRSRLDVSLLLFCVCVVLRVGRSFATA
jgi:hypothetical protein